MKAYYEIPTTGNGAYQNAYRPDVPAGFAGWAACTDPKGEPSATVLVSGSESYHNGLKASPSVAWLGDAGSRPKEKTLPTAARAKAISLFLAFYGTPVLPSLDVTEREALDLALAHHGLSWADIGVIDLVG